MDAAHEKAVASRAFIDALRECLGLLPLTDIERTRAAETRRRSIERSRAA